MEKRNAESLAGIYSVDIEKYKFKLLTDLPEASAQFSVSTWDVLRGNKIFFASDLLNTPPAMLEKLAGFTDEHLKEIRNFAAVLQKDETAPPALPADAAEPEGTDKLSPAQLQELKACAIRVPFERSFAQRFDVEGKRQVDSGILGIGLPERIGKELMNAGISRTHALLMLSPAQIIRKSKLTIFDMPKIEECVSDFLQKCHDQQTAPVSAGTGSEQVSAREPVPSPETAKNPAAPERPNSSRRGTEEAFAGQMEKTFTEIFHLPVQSFADVSVFDYDLTVRTTNVFSKNQIATVADLLQKTPEQLMKLNNFGKTCLGEIEKLLRSLSAGSADAQTVDQLPPGSAHSRLMRPYGRQIAQGDFSFAEDPATPSGVLSALARYREAQAALGSELAQACLDTPERIAPIVSACTALCNAVRQQEELRQLLAAVPEARRRNKVRGYINAYMKNEHKRAELLEIYGDGDASVESIVHAALNGEQFRRAAMFLKWCAYDLPGEIENLFQSIYKDERREMVIQMRARKFTLERIGTKLGVTRERVRQLEQDARQNFQKRQGNVKIISKIAADLNSASVVTPDDLLDDCGSRFEEVLYLLRCCPSSNYIYDETLDLFIVGDDSAQDRAGAFVESLPEMFSTKELADYLKKAEEEFDLVEEIAKKAITEAYRLTGDVYHRNRLSLGAIYQEIIKEFYPQGLRIHDPKELARFRRRVRQKFGDVALPDNDRALSARIAAICVLCGRGQYCLKQKRYIPRSLEKRIHAYIENSEHAIFMTNTLFYLFEEELRDNGVDNKYYLQGILHELFGDEYIFTRDYVSKDGAFTSIYSSVVNRIKKSQYPLTKKQLQKAFPGVPEMVMNMATCDPEVLQYLGEYLHASHLRISEQEKAYLRSVVDGLLRDGQPHHSEEFYEIVIGERPEIFARNAVLFQYRCFSVLEYLFRDQYEFSRPYIAPLGTEIGRPLEQLREFVYGNETVSLTDISAFNAEIHFHMQSMLAFVNSCNDKYLLISNEAMMTIEETGIDESIARLVEDLVCAEITETAMIRSLPCWGKLPRVNVAWTEWLVYSVLNKWGSKVEVAASNTQLRMSVPLVAPKGKMKAQSFADVHRQLDCTAGYLRTAR